MFCEFTEEVSALIAVHFCQAVFALLYVIVIAMFNLKSIKSYVRACIGLL